MVDHSAVMSARSVGPEMTKYLGGHSDVVGGAIVGKDKELGEKLAYLQNAIGGIQGPMDSFLVLRGIKTLPIRMDRHAQNAEKIVAFLEKQKNVKRLIYPFHESHPQSPKAKRPKHQTPNTIHHPFHVSPLYQSHI